MNDISRGGSGAISLGLTNCLGLQRCPANRWHYGYTAPMSIGHSRSSKPVLRAHTGSPLYYHRSRMRSSKSLRVDFAPLCGCRIRGGSRHLGRHPTKPRAWLGKYETRACSASVLLHPRAASTTSFLLLGRRRTRHGARWVNTTTSGPCAHRWPQISRLLKNRLGGRGGGNGQRKVAIITGASQGAGAGLVAAYRRHSFPVVAARGPSPSRVIPRSSRSRGTTLTRQPRDESKT
jgi:hypothetical protein